MIEVDGKLVATQTLSDTMREVWKFRVQANVTSNVPEKLKLVSRAMEHRATPRHKWREEENTAWYAYVPRRGNPKPTPPAAVIIAVRHRIAAECSNLVYEA